MQTTTMISGILQIDHERGVIYFHSNGEDLGVCPTPLRICRLGEIQAPLEDRQVDITIRPLGLDEDSGLSKYDLSKEILEVKVMK